MILLLVPIDMIILYFPVFENYVYKSAASMLCIYEKNEGPKASALLGVSVLLKLL